MRPAASHLLRFFAIAAAFAAASLLVGGAAAPPKPRGKRTPTATRTPTSTPTPVPPPPEEVLRKMGDVYASCKSYRDEGVVRMTFHEKGGDRLDERPFTTEFARPDYFRFEYRDQFSANGEFRRNLVWWDGSQAWTSFSFRPKAKKARSLDDALSSATGVSGGSAHRVPKLLMPDRISGRTVLSLKEPKLEAIEPLDGNACFKVSGIYAPEDPRITVWIDASTFLIRRVSGPLPDLSLDIVTNYLGAIDVDVERKTGL